MKRRTLRQVAADYPSLAEFGFGKGSRADLLASEKMFAETCDLLSKIKKDRHQNVTIDSRELAHLIEPLTPGEYITPGVFIAAAIACGFNVTRRAKTPHAHFNIESGSLEKLTEDSTNYLIIARRRCSPQLGPMTHNMAFARHRGQA